jgi:hypothetical protein
MSYMSSLFKFMLLGLSGEHTVLQKIGKHHFVKYTRETWSGEVVIVCCRVSLYIFGQNSEYLREGRRPSHIDLARLPRVKWMHRKAGHKKCILEEELLTTMTHLRPKSLVQLWRGLIAVEGQSASQLARDGYPVYNGSEARLYTHRDARARIGFWCDHMMFIITSIRIVNILDG